MRVPLFFCVLAIASNAFSQPGIKSSWTPSSVAFRALAVASTGSAIWTCGTDESIAVSDDGGAHWKLKHQTPDGNLLLNIQFANGRFGYAAGTGGLILTTEDGGETWSAHPGPNATILQISFADPGHGLIRTPDALQFTADGGKSWSTVSTVSDPNALKKFPYTYALVAVAPDHMAVMLKQGSAQYEPQEFWSQLTGENPGRSLTFPT